MIQHVTGNHVEKCFNDLYTSKVPLPNEAPIGHPFSTIRQDVDKPELDAKDNKDKTKAVTFDNNGKNIIAFDALFSDI